MSKVILALLIIACSFNITFAQQTKLNPDLLQRAWTKCKDQTKTYSQFRDTNSVITSIDDEIFNCASLGSKQSQCEKEKKIQNLSTQSRKFYKSCFEFIAIDKAGEDLAIKLICSSSKSKCESCIKNSGCKTFEKRNSDLQNEYDQFRNNTQTACGLTNKCRNELKPFAQASCMAFEEKSCVLDWQAKNMRNDTCVEYQNCAFKHNSTSSILKLSALILVAFFIF